MSYTTANASGVDISARDIRKMTGQEKAEWMESILSELNSLKERGVIRDVNRGCPTIRSVPNLERLPGKVVFTIDGE